MTKISLKQLVQLMAVVPVVVYVFWIFVGHDQEFQKYYLATLLWQRIDGHQLADSGFSGFFGHLLGIFTWVFSVIAFVIVNIIVWISNRVRHTQ